MIFAPSTKVKVRPFWLRTVLISKKIMKSSFLSAEAVERLVSPSDPAARAISKDRERPVVGGFFSEERDRAGACFHSPVSATKAIPASVTVLAFGLVRC